MTIPPPRRGSARSMRRGDEIDATPIGEVGENAPLLNTSECNSWPCLNKHPLTLRNPPPLR